MTTKREAKSKKPKKLRLNKETLRDLTAKGEGAQGGAGKTKQCAVYTYLCG